MMASLCLLKQMTQQKIKPSLSSKSSPCLCGNLLSKASCNVGHLMTYAYDEIVQGIAKYCGDEAAIDYDEKFRQWRQVAPQACPRNLRNMELFHTSQSLSFIQIPVILDMGVYLGISGLMVLLMLVG